MEDADQGRVERPITNPTLTQLKNSRANAKRQITRPVYRVDASIKKRDSYEEIQEEGSLLVTLLGLATEAHHDYVSSLDVDSGNQETTWLMDVEATTENCRAKMEAYFKLHLPPPTEESVPSENSNPVVNRKIAQWKTEQTLHQMTEDLSKEMEEDRELQTLESALKQRPLQIAKQRALREADTQANR